MAMETVKSLVSESAVVIFSKNRCFISYSIKALVRDFEDILAVYELDELARGREIQQALSWLGCSPTVPAVLIGGELVGGANDVASLHLNRSLIPMLREAGDLWV